MSGDVQDRTEREQPEHDRQQDPRPASQLAGVSPWQDHRQQRRDQHRVSQVDRALDRVVRQGAPIPLGPRREAPVGGRHERREEVEAVARRVVRADERIGAVREPQGDEERPDQQQRASGEQTEHPERAASQHFGRSRRDAMDQQHGSGQHAVQRVVVVAPLDEQQARGREDRVTHALPVEQAKPEQQEQRHPFDRHEVQVAVGACEVVAAEREREATGDRGRPRAPARDVVHEPCGREAGGDEREQQHQVVAHTQRHRALQRRDEEAVERVERLGDQRDAVRVEQPIGEPRIVQVGDRLPDPPEVPRIREPVPGVSEKMRAEVGDRRPRQDREASEVAERGREDEAPCELRALREDRHVTRIGRSPRSRRAPRSGRSGSTWRTGRAVSR